MRIAFLGLGRMGRELVRHLLDPVNHEIIVWNRTGSVAQPFAELGAQVAASAEQAVSSADVVMTCLFGPQAVREVVVEPSLVKAGQLWVDISTVGPVMADHCADWARTAGVDYVHAPVLGSLGPAKARDLGVLIGGTSPSARQRTSELVAAWADPTRVRQFDTAAKAATGKLVVNYGLAVGMQALIEAVRIGQAGGLTRDEAVGLAQLPKTPLSIIAAMKGAALLSGDYSDTQFSTDLLAKDADLMLRLAEGEATPALTAAFASLEHARRLGHGEDDFSSMAG
ncbi:MAG: NAD(P)-dependent oxidoreductase [Propionibacteriaceae bacterium]|jgi:3-hydroxyisobutyrate dehydrogenase|nr:NAD(P)-dependent oxidoreductase [Propionibacteriaceae bacterium]